MKRPFAAATFNYKGSNQCRFVLEPEESCVGPPVVVTHAPVSVGRFTFAPTAPNPETQRVSRNALQVLIFALFSFFFFFFFPSLSGVGDLPRLYHLLLWRQQAVRQVPPKPVWELDSVGRCASDAHQPWPGGAVPQERAHLCRQRSKNFHLASWGVGELQQIS